MMSLNRSIEVADGDFSLVFSSCFVRQLCPFDSFLFLYGSPTGMWSVYYFFFFVSCSSRPHLVGKSRFFVRSLNFRLPGLRSFFFWRVAISGKNSEFTALVFVSPLGGGVSHCISLIFPFPRAYFPEVGPPKPSLEFPPLFPRCLLSSSLFGPIHFPKNWRREPIPNFFPPRLAQLRSPCFS